MAKAVSTVFFFFHAEAGIRDPLVNGVQTCALPISAAYAILVPQRRVRVPTKPGEGGPPDGQRGDLRPGVVGPAEEGPDDRVADGGAARARRQAASRGCPRNGSLR